MTARERLLAETEDMDWPELPALLDAIEAEATAAKLAELRAAVEFLTRYAGSVPHSWGSAVARAAVLDLIDEASK